MKAPPFQYHRPKTRQELGALLAQLENAKILAGGQSLMPMMNLRVIAPDHLIDINRIPTLAGIREDGDTIEIGAMTRQADILSSEVVRSRIPLLAAALQHVGHIQTRARGTIGGSCCHLDPSAEQPAICTIFDADFIVGGPQGQRIVAARDWFKGLLESALGENEFLEALRIKPWSAGHGYGFAEYARRHGDFAIAGGAALLEADQRGHIIRAALVAFGVQSAPRRLTAAESALIGRHLDDLDKGSVVAAARKLDAMEDTHVTAGYRRHLAGVLIRRALDGARATLEKQP